ncbi:MAG: hypothetical protein OXN84_20790 [Albidovulum sp.]|nr:hypothetical protein [Albidovulum sp.]
MKAAETVNAGSAGSSIEPSSMFSGLYGKLPIEQGDRVDEWQRSQSAQALYAVDSESGSNHCIKSGFPARRICKEDRIAMVA